MSNQTLDVGSLMTGKDGQLFVTGADRNQIFLAEVDSFKAQVSFANADFQPVGSYLGYAVPVSYTVTLTFSEAVIRDDVVLKPLYDALGQGIAPTFEFCGRFRTADGRYNRKHRPDEPDAGRDSQARMVVPGELRAAAAGVPDRQVTKARRGGGPGICMDDDMSMTGMGELESAHGAPRVHTGRSRQEYLTGK